MKRFPYFALFTIMLVMACAIPGLSPAPTSTPLPTNTSEPTVTPPPTNTPTQTPTATPNAAATAAAKSTESAGTVLAELAKLLGDTEIPYKEGSLAWQQAKPLTIEMSGPSDEIIEIDADLQAANFIFKSDITWEATGILLCGAIFRSEENLKEGEQYAFLYLRLSGLPAWAIEVHEFGRYKNSPSDIQYSNALDLTNGATNQFVIIAQENQFNVYLNRVRQGRFFDNSSQRTEGIFGFLASQDSGKGSCVFENSWVWTLE